MPGQILNEPADRVGVTGAHRPAIRGTRHMAASCHYGATHAAFQILEAGGNAVDAGVAAGIALGVLQCDLVNVAGKRSSFGYLNAQLNAIPGVQDGVFFLREGDSGGISGISRLAAAVVAPNLSVAAVMKITVAIVLTSRPPM